MNRYDINDRGFTRNTKKGIDQLTNFTVRIAEELTYHDGPKKTTVLKMEGEILHPGDKPEPLPQVTVSASDFGGMGWVAEQWGMAPIIYPVESAERDLKAAIQIASKPIKRHIYTHTGWTRIKDEATYLSMSGGISKSGLDPSIQVELPNELRNIRLPPPSDLTTLMGKQEAKDAWTASIQLANVGPKDLMWPLILACYRAAVGPCDFAMHITGKTGTFKSEIASLLQSHFGVDMDARHLPCSWASTENANEALLYRAKDAICVIDDFVPQGTSYAVKTLQGKADRLIRGQGNQAGRARLTDVSSLQQTMYPRGIILSTGEDTPEGHSVRARMLIMEIDPGSIPVDRLSHAQTKRPILSQAMSDWIFWLTQGNAKDVLRASAQKHRDGNIGVGHSRTPPILGELIATAELLTMYARDRGYYPPEKCSELCDLAWKQIIIAGNKQLTYLQEADPVEALLEAIKRMLGTKAAHARTRNGGVPKDAEQLGFTRTQTSGEADNYAAHGSTIGWVDYHKGEFLLDPMHLVAIKKLANIAVTDATLTKRIKEAGILTRTDDSREQIKVRVTTGGVNRYVLAIRLDHILEELEVSA